MSRRSSAARRVSINTYDPADRRRSIRFSSRSSQLATIYSPSDAPRNQNLEQLPEEPAQYQQHPSLQGSQQPQQQQQSPERGSQFVSRNNERGSPSRRSSSVTAAVRYLDNPYAAHRLSRLRQQRLMGSHDGSRRRSSAISRASLLHPSFSPSEPAANGLQRPSTGIANSISTSSFLAPLPQMSGLPTYCMVVLLFIFLVIVVSIALLSLLLHYVS